MRPRVKGEKKKGHTVGLCVLELTRSLVIDFEQVGKSKSVGTGWASKPKLDQVHQDLLFRASLDL